MTIYQILSLLGIPSLFAAVLLSGFNYIKYRHSSNKLIKDGVLAILHNKIYTLGKLYIAQRYITLDDLDDFKHLYEAYHALGGNGTGTDIYERVRALEIR